MKIGFRIDEGAGPHTVAVTPAAMVAWETANGRSVADLANGIGITEMTELVWRQRVLEGYGESLEVFRSSLVDIDPVASGNPT